MKPDWDALANEFGDVIMDVDCGDQKEVRVGSYFQNFLKYYFLESPANNFC